MSELVKFQNEFNRYEAVIEVSKDGTDFFSKVDIEDYTVYTKNVEENDKVICANNLIHALDLTGKYSKIYPVTIQQAVSGFLQFDLRENRYRVRL